MKNNRGFEGRAVLTFEEWSTYLKRMPVRYIKRKHSTVCFFCGEPPVRGNPLQHAHRIGFNIGIKKYALTPDYLDSDTNIVSAHRTRCNKAVELSEDEVEDQLHAQGINVPMFVQQRI